MKRIVIVGGGIAGLAAAHALERASEPCKVMLLEAGAQLGGNIVTHRHNGFVIDGGPDSWVAAKPHATRLARDVGLGDELIGTREDTRKVYIVAGRRLHPLPEGMILGVPTEIAPFLSTDLLGLDAKARAGLDWFIPRKRYAEGEDETIASFVTRRLGRDVAERIAAPLLGGIFAGDAEALSARACIPQLVEAEAKYGSLIEAMRVLRKQREKERSAAGVASAFLSLKRGMGDLVVNVAHRLRDAEVRTSTRVRRIQRAANGQLVLLTDGGSITADHVAVLVPAFSAAEMVADLDADLASMLGEIAYASTATVFLGYRKFDVRHPMDAHGFLVPRSENLPVLACTFVSSKWDHRAPSGQLLLRMFFGGATNEAVLQNDDDALVRMARAQLRSILGIERAPAFARVFRFTRASPQPHVGHLSRVARIHDRVARQAGLYLGGNGFMGTGIPDSIKQGEAIAARIMPLFERAVGEMPREAGPGERETQPSQSPL